MRNISSEEFGRVDSLGQRLENRTRPQGNITEYHSPQHCSPFLGDLEDEEGRDVTATHVSIQMGPVISCANTGELGKLATI